MDIITICNQHCWYCYARPESNPTALWGKIMNLSKAKKLIDGMSKIKYKIILSILGGEPTLHKNLNEIIEYASKKDNIISIELFTNGKKPLLISYNPKLFVNFSFHPSQTNGDSIIENAKKTKTMNIPLSISCLFEKESKQFYDFINKLKKTKLLEYAKIGIVDSHIPAKPLIVKVPKTELFEGINEKEFLLDNNPLTLDEIREKKLNNFFGWKCYKHCLKIDVDGSIAILGGKSHNLTFDEFKNYIVRVDVCDGVCCNDDNNLIFNRKVLE